MDKTAGSDQTCILFVDDDENILRSLARLFREEGYEILTATSGVKGLEILKEREVAVVVSDLGMLKMTGREFLTHVEEISPDTVMIILTGFTDPMSFIDAVDEDSYECMTKPWNKGHLISSVRGAVERCKFIKEDR